MEHIVKVFFFGFFLAVLTAMPVHADNDTITAEELPIEFKGKDIVVDDKKAAEPVTPEQQAALICQSAELMGKKLQGADYVPGVDAYGNPVSAADVYNSMPFEVPDQIEVPMHVDVMAALGVTAPPIEGKGEIGTLVITKGGVLTFNGQDITNTIEGYCRKHLEDMKAEDAKKNQKKETTQ